MSSQQDEDVIGHISLLRTNNSINDSILNHNQRYNRIIMRRLTKLCSSSFSTYLETLYQASIPTQTPFFRVDSSQIQILDDPLDFYLHLNNSVSQSSLRIGLSSLYLGTGTLERHLLANIAKRHRLCPDLRSAMAFDYHRSHREENGDSPYNILSKFTEEIGSRAKVGFLRLGQAKGVIGEVLGVHHQKIYIFDDRVVLGGANLSKNYFLNRKDRYMSIHSPELSDYLFDYLQILSQQPNPKQLQTHYKLWKYAYMPAKYQPTFAEQLASLKQIDSDRQKQKARTFSWEKAQKKGMVLSKNQQIAEQLGTSIMKAEPMAPAKFEQVRQDVRDRLFSIGGQDYVANELQQLGDPFSEPLALTGQEVYLFPFINWHQLKQTSQYQLFKKILLNASKQGHTIRISSGYLNIDQELFSQIAIDSKKTPAVELLCSSPGANSFYRGGTIKKFIPFMYRCYEHSLKQKMGDKLVIKQFENGRWSYHAKGLWLEEAENSFLSVIGSSNFNERSRNRDSELQLYIYSGCKALNYRLNRQWSSAEKDCKPIGLKEMEEDDEIKVGWTYKTLSRMFSSLL